MDSSRHRFGLWGKLTLAILAAGTIPIVVGLSVAYVRGTGELREVIGESFEALAKDSALKLDAAMQRVIAVDRLLAEEAATDARLRTALSAMRPAADGSIETPIRLDWPVAQDRGHTPETVLATWVTRDQKAQPTRPGASATTTISALRFDEVKQRYFFRVSTAIADPRNQIQLGSLQRDYDVKAFFDPLVYPTRFGETGHVMLIDNRGAIVSCPDLVTGGHIEDQSLVARIARDAAGWIVAESDGHGGQRTSLIGHAPLPGVNPLLEAGASWHMFVWQDSREIFAPAKSLLIGVALAALLAIGLLAVLGYYASSRIVNPIRRLREEASHIAGGDLNRTLDLPTGDEIEELAGQFNEMRVQLRQLIGSLEEKVAERTRELVEAQAEKDRVMQQLIQTEKVAAIGTMASGIGHEINNPLYAILGMAEAIRDEKDISQCNEYGRDIIKHSKHIGEIVKNLSGYVRPASQHDLEQVDVNQKLSEAVSMARRSLLSDRVDIKEKLTPVAGIAAKAEEIQQVFFNIIRNGIQAMNGTGILEISSSQEGNRVSIKIRDSGVGIAPEHVDKVFDPFFTTKGPEEGEGLGLYIVQQIVKKYAGNIAVESEQGQGTVFIIDFPIGKEG